MRVTMATLTSTTPMNSFTDFASPAQVRHISRQSLWYNQNFKSAKPSLGIMNCVGPPSLLFLQHKHSRERVRWIGIPSATESKNSEAKVTTDRTSQPDPQTNLSENTNTTPQPNETSPKRPPLTAREKLRAARLLSRYTTETKPSKPRMGSKLLEALKENDKGKKRSGLPEAPTNLFDDSKRGMPKQSWTFDFPGGRDLFLIGVSFVLITTVMLGTTYIVWKVGAIHFNEY